MVAIFSQIHHEASYPFQNLNDFRLFTCSLLRKCTFICRHCTEWALRLHSSYWHSAQCCVTWGWSSAQTRHTTSFHPRLTLLPHLPTHTLTHEHFKLSNYTWVTEANSLQNLLEPIAAALLEPVFFFAWALKASWMKWDSEDHAAERDKFSSAQAG